MDLDLRTLERRSLAGDPEASDALLRQRVRLLPHDRRWPAWLKRIESAHEDDEVQTWEPQVCAYVAFCSNCEAEGEEDDWCWECAAPEEQYSFGEAVPQPACPPSSGCERCDPRHETQIKAMHRADAALEAAERFDLPSALEHARAARDLMEKAGTDLDPAPYMAGWGLVKAITEITQLVIFDGASPTPPRTPRPAPEPTSEPEPVKTQPIVRKKRRAITPPSNPKHKTLTLAILGLAAVSIILGIVFSLEPTREKPHRTAPASQAPVSTQGWDFNGGR